jgi:hypothetical protein
MDPDQERSWVAYAWPAQGETGTMLAITPAGTLYAAPWQGEEPAWNALFGEAGWSGVPTWELYKPSDRKAAPAREPEPKTGGEPLF